jgi:hypothetical protein
VLAAFYEASGASTCNLGIDCPRRNRCAPFQRTSGAKISLPARKASPKTKTAPGGAVLCFVVAREGIEPPTLRI